MIDFTVNNLDKLSEQLKGKRISNFYCYDRSGNEYMVFEFTDDTYLEFRYDWIYEYDLSDM